MKNLSTILYLFLLYSTLLAHCYGFMGDHMYWGGGWSWLVIIIFIAAILILINRKQERNEPDETPMSILQKRYAKGEITEEEFEKMKLKLQ